MPITLAFDTQMTAALYSALGEAVTYTGSVDGAVSIDAIIDRPDEQFPAEFEVTVSDSNVTARIKVADVPAPRRGDTLVDVNNGQYTVDTYQKINASEWAMELRGG